MIPGLDPALPLVVGRVLRIDPRPDGAVFEQRQALDGPSWWRGRGEAAVPCVPCDDPRLPLARRLAALGRRADLTLLAYRPERRLVVKLVDEQGARVLKGYRRSRFAAAETVHRWASLALAQGALAAAPSPRSHAKECALEWPFLEGQPLDLHPEAADGFFRLGDGLASLQAKPTWPDAPRHEALHEIEVLDKLCASLERAGLALPPGWRSVRASLVPGPEHESVTLRACHRDLHDGQLMVVGGRLVLLDFDLACVADPALDPANLIAHLKLRELQGLAGATDASVDRCGRELLDGLGRDGEPDFARRLRFYQGAAFLRLALVYALRPPWAHLSRELLGVGERCLHES